MMGLLDEEDLLANLAVLQQCPVHRLPEARLIVREYETEPVTDPGYQDCLRVKAEVLRTNIQWKAPAVAAPQQDVVVYDGEVPAAPPEGWLEAELGRMLGAEGDDGHLDGGEPEEDEDHADDGEDEEDPAEEGDEENPAGEGVLSEYNKICRDLNVVDVGSHVRLRSGETIGRLDVCCTMFASSVKAVCASHGPTCQLFMYARTGYFGKVRSSLEWLKDGASMDADAHQQQARARKEVFGIRARAAAAPQPAAPRPAGADA